MSHDERKTYEITSDYKKSTWQEEYWTNQLKNGKNVILRVTTIFRWGTFEITLTDKEKQEISEKSLITLNDYEFSLVEMLDGWHDDIEIQDENNYSADEIQEINCLIYCEDFQNTPDYEYDSDNGDDFQEDILETNGWDLDDTIYIISSGCILKEIA